MSKKKSPVSPTIREEGIPHAMEALFDQDDMPTLKSVGYAKLPGTGSWVAYVITSKGKDVLKIEVDEPNMRQIAEESAKTNFVTQFVDLL